MENNNKVNTALNALNAIKYILNKNNKIRKINKNDLYMNKNNVKFQNKNNCSNDVKIESYRKQKEFGLSKFIKP